MKNYEKIIAERERLEKEMPGMPKKIIKIKKGIERFEITLEQLPNNIRITCDLISFDEVDEEYIDIPFEAIQEFMEFFNELCKEAEEGGNGKESNT